MIYLLRHCEKTDEAAEAPLSNKGFRQAENLIPAFAKLGIKRVLCSPYLRAHQSIAPFSKAAGLTIETADALKEWQLAGEMRADWKDVLTHGLTDPDAKAAGGESAGDIWTRAKSVLHPKEPTLLVTHGGWLTVVLGHYGRACDLESLFAIKSPDLFSIGPNGYHHHEL